MGHRRCDVGGAASRNEPLELWTATPWKFSTRGIIFGGSGCGWMWGGSKTWNVYLLRKGNGAKRRLQEPESYRSQVWFIHSSPPLQVHESESPCSPSIKIKNTFQPTCSSAYREAMIMVHSGIVWAIGRLVPHIRIPSLQHWHSI